ncbi:MAG: 4-hydroxyacetophenone monooxygenase, partial [Candidatus Dormibacteria bacterium]
VVVMAEAQVEYVLDSLRFMRRRGVTSVEVKANVQQAYNERLQADLQRTVWNAGGCASWYLDATGRNTTLWPTYTFTFARQMRTFDASEYMLRSGASRSERPAA